MGPEMPCYRPELAPGLAGSHPVLFLPWRGLSDRLCNERHSGLLCIT